MATLKPGDPGFAQAAYGGSSSSLNSILSPAPKVPSFIVQPGASNNRGSTLPSSPVYNLANTSMAPGLISSGDIAATVAAVGAAKTENIIMSMGQMPSPVPSVNTVNSVVNSQTGPAVPEVLGMISNELGGYYTQQYPYGTYFGSVMIGGDDDYSGVAYFPFINPQPWKQEAPNPLLNDSSVYRLGEDRLSYSSRYVPRYRYSRYSRYNSYSRYRYPSTGRYGYRSQRWQYANGNY